MKSYIKLYGPPIYEAIKELEKMAIDMPEVCIMNQSLAQEPGLYQGTDDRMGGTQLIVGGVYQYYLDVGEITYERCKTIISSKAQELGEYDFFFEWFKDPSRDQLESLIKKVDEVLKPLDVRYTITTK